MNHDILRDTLYQTVMTVYNVLVKEYNNEDFAKKKTFQIAKKVMDDFYPKGDIVLVYGSLLEQYKACTDEQLKFELRNKLTTLQEAIKIIGEEADN